MCYLRILGRLYNLSYSCFQGLYNLLHFQPQKGLAPTFTLSPLTTSHNRQFHTRWKAWTMAFQHINKLYYEYSWKVFNELGSIYF